MHARKSRAEWTAIIEAYERTGGAHAAFCASRGLKLASFRGWLYRLRRATATTGAITLLPVAVTSAPAASPPADLVVVVAGVEVRVPVGADVGYVAAVVTGLRSRC
jgi:hypothetical protein